MNWFQKISSQYNPPPRAWKALGQYLNSREPSVRKLAQQLKDTINDFIIEERTKGPGPRWGQLRNQVLELQHKLDMSEYDRFMDYKIKPQESEYNSVMPKHGNIKVLELDQFTATAANLSQFSLLDFDPDKLKGGDTEAAKELFNLHYQILFVNENDSPSIGNVWLKDGPNGKLQVWKANYDSSD